MGFNWQTFRTRTLTAAVFVVVMLVGLLWNQWSFFILFSIIHFGCWWEYLKLIEKTQKITFYVYFKIGLMLLGYGLICWFGILSYQVNFGLKELIFSVIPLVGFFLLTISLSKISGNNIKTLGFAALGLLYISLSLGLMMDLFYTDVFDSFRRERGGHYIVEFFSGFGILPLVIVFTIWINDTMAYIVGSLIGKTPLSKISPKKTWEGTIGGIILSVVVVGLLFSSNFPLYKVRDLYKEYPYTINNVYWYITAAIASVVGTIGDLLESKLKRLANVKDSGHIMPGHGGFLDRFDSMLLAIPAVWLFVYFFLR